MSLLIAVVLPHMVSPYLVLCLVYYAICPLSRQLSSIAASSSSKVNVLMKYSALLCQCAVTLMNLPFFLRDSRASETRARVKITPLNWALMEEI